MQLSIGRRSHRSRLSARSSTAGQFETDTTEAHRGNAAFEAKLAAVSRVHGAIEFKSTGEIIDANENLLSLLGYRLDEINGKHHRVLVDKEPEQSDVSRVTCSPDCPRL
ncbi:PAS domain-containing protein [Rhizobium cremeum]|uniref:PAS domain-containing protein n=1 Tax=Rhizobium cremeum TaxID=2813827 RepID=UPI001FD5F322